MNPTNPLFAIAVFIIAYITGLLLNRNRKLNETARYETIDSLRGFLALGVFIHHSNLWYQYVQDKSWEKPASNFYVHLGETSVAFFFMITAFLFISKLLNTGEKEFNWYSFLHSRLFRLFPMYIFSVVVLILCIMYISHWQVKTSVSVFAASLFHWSAFGITRLPLINDSNLTSIVNAGVVWSLRLEWLFYFSLPLISLFILKKKPSIFYLLISLLFVLGFIIAHGINVHYVFSFLGGCIAPFLLKYGKRNINFDAPVFSLVILVSLGLIGLYDTASNVMCKLLIAIIFTLIAMGNHLFGLLKNSTLKFLGDICYSTYLTHGIILFVLFYFIIGTETAKSFSSAEYCFVIFLITPVVVVISFLGYKFIESPFMTLSKKNNQRKKQEVI